MQSAETTAASATRGDAFTEAASKRLRTAPRSNWSQAARRFLRQRLAMAGLAVALVLVLMAVFAPLVAPTHYEKSDLMSASLFPSREHLFGTDAIGHDYLSRIIYGLRTSLVVGFAAVLVACLIGVPLGLLAGLRGGLVDFAVMRVVEVMTAFPGILFAIFLLSVVNSGVMGGVFSNEVVNIVFVIGVTSWVLICRLARAQLLTLREQEYVAAARSIGASEWSIAVRHLLPNALAPMIVAVTLSIPVAIFTEAGLSFLGIGINEPTPSLGKMVADSAPYLQVYWYLGFFPTVAIALIMLSFTFVGDGLRDALDPRQT